MTTIRDATPADIPAVLALYHQLTLNPAKYRDPSPAAVERAVAEIVANEWVHLLVAAGAGGRVTGTLVLAIIPNLSYGARPWAVIENMVVDTAARRRGAGRALVEEALRRARDAGCYKVELQSRREREWAHGFYESCGFQARATGYKFYFDGDEPLAGAR